MTRVAVASRSFSRHKVLRAELTARYPDATFNEAGRALEGEELIHFLKGHDKAITALEKMTAEVFAAVPELKVVGKVGVGFDMIDLHAMRSRGIRLGWIGGVNCRSVAELVIALSIMLLRHLPRANAEVRSGRWQQPKGRHLSGRTIGIVGCGHIGKELAILLRALGCHVLANDVRDFSEFYKCHQIQFADLDLLLKSADIVTLHVPLDVTTRGLIDARRLSLMRHDSILINTARGGLVDEGALKKALNEGGLGAAAFDVFATEPPSDTQLLSLPNFFATPHLGAATEEAVLAMGRAAIRGLDENHVPEPGVHPEGNWPT